MTTQSERNNRDGTESDDSRDARVPAGADRPPTPAEEAVAEELATHVGSATKERFDEMARLGASVRGEGQIEPE